MIVLLFESAVLLTALQIGQCFSFTFPMDRPRWIETGRRFNYPSNSRGPQADPVNVQHRFLWPDQINPNVQQNNPGIIFDSPSVSFRGRNIDRPPQRPTTIEPTTERMSTQEGPCNLENFTIPYPPTSTDQKCEVLLTQGPCNNGEWLIADEDLLPICVPRPCPVGFYPLDQGDCVEKLRCSRGKAPFISFDGKLFCICDIGTVLWKPDGKCYRTYEQGPCNQTSYLALNESKQPECVLNVCDNTDEVPANALQNRMDGSVVIDIKVGLDFQCYMTGTQGPCREGEILVADLFTLNLACEDSGLNLRQLLRTAPLRCSSGEFRDRSGRCRRGHRVMDFRTLFFG